MSQPMPIAEWEDYLNTMSNGQTKKETPKKEVSKTTKKNSITLKDKIKEVNEILKKGEPGNVSLDPYTKYTGYSPQHIIDALNAVMLGEWGYNEVYNEKVDMEDKQVFVSKIEVWIKGIDFRPTAYGQGTITRGSYGDAKKSAQTDALKKALSYFSIGNRAFHGLLTTTENKT